jgi:hypothetical protein
MEWRRGGAWVVLRNGEGSGEERQAGPDGGRAGVRGFELKGTATEHREAGGWPF